MHTPALVWCSVEHKQMTRAEYLACLFGLGAREGRLWTCQVLAGARALRERQRTSAEGFMTLASYRA